MNHQSRTQTANSNSRHLLIEDIFVPDIDAFRDSTELLRITQTQNSHRRSLGPQLIWKRTILIPLTSKRNHLAIEKAPQLSTPFLVFSGQVTIV